MKEKKMQKLLIEIYAVTNQNVIDDDGNAQSIHHIYHQLMDQFNNSYMKDRVELKFIDVLTDKYEEKLATDNLSQKMFLPWTYFNGELEFYNGISESMIYQEAIKQMKFKIKR